MEYHVRLTEKANQDVDAVLAWFHKQRAESAASKWLDQLFVAVDTLETMPQRCGIAAEAADIGLEIRELIVGRRMGTYRVIFQIKRRTVYILRVWHSSRDAIKRDDL